MQNYTPSVGDVVAPFGGPGPYTVAAVGTLGGVTRVYAAEDDLNAAPAWPLGNVRLISSASGAALFATSVTGSGSVSASAVVNGDAWQPDTYTVTFSSASDWTVTDSEDIEIASGDSQPISFLGVSITVTGAAEGTSITVTPTDYYPQF